MKFNHDYRKNTPRKYVVQNLCPSISLLQNNQFIPKDKERHKKLKVTNFYKAFVENRKKTESYFKNMKQIHNMTNSRAKSNLGESSFEKEKTKSPISRIDMSMVYREGF